MQIHELNFSYCHYSCHEENLLALGGRGKDVAVSTEDEAAFVVLVSTMVNPSTDDCACATDKPVMAPTDTSLTATGGVEAGPLTMAEVTEDMFTAGSATEAEKVAGVGAR